MTQGPQAPKTLYGLQYYINPKVGADLGLPLTTNPINFSAMLENGLSANAWGVCVEKSRDIFIYCRDHMKQVKISLHKSGLQFVAFTKESDIKMTGNSRLWHRWSEPEHHDDSSLVPTFNLQLPSWGLALSQETRDANGGGLGRQPYIHRSYGRPDSHDSLFRHQKLRREPHAGAK